MNSWIENIMKYQKLFYHSGGWIKKKNLGDSLVTNRDYNIFIISSRNFDILSRIVAGLFHQDEQAAEAVQTGRMTLITARDWWRALIASPGRTTRRAGGGDFSSKSLIKAECALLFVFIYINSNKLTATNRGEFTTIN